jgi:hypothetical protein
LKLICLALCLVVSAAGHTADKDFYQSGKYAPKQAAPKKAGPPRPAPRRKQLKIQDKIGLISHPLMKRATANGRLVSFEWEEPHWEFKYYLEIYKKGHTGTYGVIPVKGGKKSMKFRADEKDLFWRISAVSQHGNKNPNKKVMPVPLK